MRTRYRQLVRHLALAGAVASLPGLLRSQNGGVHWHDNYRAALQEARQTGKPIFLEFRCEP